MRRVTRPVRGLAVPLMGSCLLVLCVALLVSGCAQEPSREYGVFLGISGNEIERLDGYDIVVIEPSEFNAEQIEALHADGTTVYGYLNVGAIEGWRPYYDRFRDMTLGVYEDWPDERWVDVTSAAWRDFIVNELGKEYAAMGLDGFFLDNADVYHHYRTDETFEGLSLMLRGLKGYGLPLVVNGGDDFVSRCIDDGSAQGLFDGINQETVFTSIDFERGTYGERTEGECAFWQDYLAKVKQSGLSVYLLEYGADQGLAMRIDAYCRENGFLWYDAEGLELR